ncbi:hypothetical protein TTHERM_00239360 (macronuclear) [Tetrahymena thermophila SB210]|uniref:Uncharacterized protein n=1 Tax=Tetrahymena thermophila (strain SB210) TaxID=312017 RepID=I7MAH7_TETTS|nr:hypothetical protein TTHERM_00239360 [Tetrahymena thermophila SB210]EAS04615.2 hypothetical protein TTHERM_00239360 [Tetrahymena thermophila SB210]|eukprot:XP_001024860.2 hypothetical protein TTHERM_00239360 [Tetrahymena thermophila SB210]
MRPTSAHGRGLKITAATQENFYNNNKAKYQKANNNPILVGKGILSDEQIEQQIFNCKQNEIELLKAQMNLKLDVNQKKQEETKKIIMNGYEEQCKLINEMNEKKMDTLKQEQEKFVEKLLLKQKQEIKDLEQSYESKIKQLKQQIDEQQKEIIRRQEEMGNQFEKEKERLEQKHQKKLEETKQKQKSKFNSKIERMKQEWIEEQEEDKAKVKKECQKVVQQEIIEMKQLINNMKEQINEYQIQLNQRTLQVDELNQQLKQILEQNALLQKKVVNLDQSKKRLKAQNDINESSENSRQLHNQQSKQKCQKIAEQDESSDLTDFESLSSDQISEQQIRKDQEEDFAYINQIQQDVSVPYSGQVQQNNNGNSDNCNTNTNDEQEMMDLQQLQSDIKQSIRYQINLLHSKSQQNSNQFNQGNQLDTLGPFENNAVQNSLENISLKIEKNESIKIQSKDIYQNKGNSQFLNIDQKINHHLQDISLNDSQDVILETQTEGNNRNVYRTSQKFDKCINTSFDFKDEVSEKQKEIENLRIKIENQNKEIENQRRQMERIINEQEIQFNKQMKNVMEKVVENKKRESIIIKNYQFELSNLMTKIQNITNIINEAELLPNMKQNQEVLLVKKQNQEILQNNQPKQGEPNNKIGENKSDQKKSEIKSPKFVIHQKQNTQSQKAQIIVRSSIKSVNNIDQKQIQQINNKQNKI